MNNIFTRNADLIQKLIMEDHSRWDSLVINKREPHTQRQYRYVNIEGDSKRICLHTFQPCTSEESFEHPHSWPAAFLILAGGYDMNVSMEHGIDDCRYPIAKFYMGRGSSYIIDDPMTWHKITPRYVTHSIMINGPDFDSPSDAVRTTKGKDLPPMSNADKDVMLRTFRSLFENWRGVSSSIQNLKQESNS